MSTDVQSKPPILIMHQDAILGRMVCNGPCGKWRYLMDFPCETKRVKSGEAHIYIKSVCYRCTQKRTKTWWRNLSKEQKRKHRRRETEAKFLRIKRERANLLLGRVEELANGQVDAWPVRQWVILNLPHYKVEDLAWILDVQPNHILELAQGYVEPHNGCELRPIRTVEKRILDNIRDEVRARQRDTTDG